MEPTVRGSPNPSIAFCLTIKQEHEELIPRILSFVKEFQERSPIFADSDGKYHKMKCETIIRTDIPKGTANANWMKVFNPGSIPTGIDDFYIFEYLDCPWGSRSMIECILRDPSDLPETPRTLSFAIKDLLMNDKLDGSCAGFTIVVHVDQETAQFYKARELQRIASAMTRQES